ncbi:hypothetical protein [Polynucleobacter sp. MWH-Berg-3C6]|uniref:hypothetical protein n=1 Tax=Polynucleobacter sp. MWH-Berg-3C6 TaxID=1855882 RepID=UPI001C0B6071|nr:hypothetical protein [Polynucleobacter sp. MWH-Berg-3C6]MBU3551420.1 hypothetical protein [Polynucleobacter sp. MWH-Berg-3C6]
MTTSIGKTQEVPNLSRQEQADIQKLSEEMLSDDEMLPLLLWDFLNEDDKNWIW